MHLLVLDVDRADQVLVELLTFDNEVIPAILELLVELFFLECQVIVLHLGRWLHKHGLELFKGEF